MMVHSALSRVTHRIQDKSPTGGYAGVVLQGAKDKENNVNMHPSLALISVYAPTPSKQPGSTWQTWKQIEGIEEPRLHFIKSLIAEIRSLHAKGINVIVGGTLT